MVVLFPDFNTEVKGVIRMQNSIFEARTSLQKREGPDIGSNQQKVKIKNKRSKADFTVGNIYIFYQYIFIII